MNEIFDVEKEARLVSSQMATLYLEYQEGKFKREEADSLANIAGKNLKAISIIVMNRMFGQVHLPKLILTRDKMKLIGAKKIKK